MTDELKPVRCGCGGEAKAMSNDSHLDGCIFHFVKCAECGIDTAFYDTEAEAITAWNKAMSGNVQKCAKDAQCSKRATKVPYCPEKYYCDDALKLMVMNIFGDYIYATHDIDLEKLREALNTLSEREQRIMYLRYQNNETLENIGKEFGVTKERIRQIIARALRILRHPKFKIAKAKPAEPERKKGEWIKEYLSGYLTPGGNSIYHCSECGHTEGPWPWPRLTNFCPSCGMDMRGEDGKA